MNPTILAFETSCDETAVAVMRGTEVLSNVISSQVGLHARFGGVSRHVSVPMPAVLAIYARENGKGMMFPADGEHPEPGGDEPGPDTGRPHLKVVK